MKASTNDQLQGTLYALKGKAKENAGKVANNPRSRGRGQEPEARGQSPKESRPD